MPAKKMFNPCLSPQKCKKICMIAICPYRFFLFLLKFFSFLCLFNFFYVYLVWQPHSTKSLISVHFTSIRSTTRKYASCSCGAFWYLYVYLYQAPPPNSPPKISACAVRTKSAKVKVTDCVPSPLHCCHIAESLYSIPNKCVDSSPLWGSSISSSTKRAK